jgi:hypothetical protein
MSNSSMYATKDYCMQQVFITPRVTPVPGEEDDECTLCCRPVSVRRRCCPPAMPYWEVCAGTPERRAHPLRREGVYHTKGTLRGRQLTVVRHQKCTSGAQMSLRKSRRCAPHSLTSQWRRVVSDVVAVVVVRRVAMQTPLLVCATRAHPRGVALPSNGPSSMQPGVGDHVRGACIVFGPRRGERARE